MNSLVFLIIPIFLVILLGKILQYTLIKGDSAWKALNQLSYWVLFPAFLFHKTSTLDLTDSSLGNFSSALLVGFIVAVILAFIMAKLCKISAAPLTSVLQGAGRHNTFIPLAVVTALYGEQGSALGAVAIAVLVPFSNIVMVVLLSLINQRSQRKRDVFYQLMLNPIIIAIAVGLSVNGLGWSQDAIIYPLSQMLAQATLPIVLLCIGAGLKFQGARTQLLPCMLACINKMIIFPLTVYLFTLIAQLPATLSTIAVIYAIAPTSPAGYPLAKQLGGDAPLIASIISVQTALAVLAIPLVISLMQAIN